MNFLITGDRHFTDRRPEKRKDENYFETQIGKFKQEIDIYKEYKCDAMLQPGDFFNSPNVSREIDATIIEMLMKEDIRIFTVWGQHDVTGHSKATLKRSPLRVLEAARIVKIVDYSGVQINENIEIFGCPYGGEIPEVNSNDKFNILLIHAMIGDKELYPGQDIISPVKFSKENSQFNLVVCGDYHYTFCERHGNCTVVNAGCLVRKTISERDLTHKPCVFVYDITDNSCKKIELKVDPVDVVFDFSEVEKKDSSELAKFIESLRTSNQNFASWRDILLKVFEEKKTNGRVKEIVNECMEEIKINK